MDHGKTTLNFANYLPHYVQNRANIEQAYKTDILNRTPKMFSVHVHFGDNFTIMNFVWSLYIT